MLSTRAWKVPEFTAIRGAQAASYLEQIAREVRVPAGRELWTSERTDPCTDWFAVLLAGGVDVRRDGRLVDIVFPTEAVGLSALLGRPHTAEAVGMLGRGAIVLLIDARPFSGASPTAHPAVAHAILQLVARSDRATIGRLNNFAHANPFERFVHVLRLLVGRTPRRISHTQRDLAQLVGVDEGQVSRYVRYLKDEKAIPNEKGLRVSDPTLLRKLTTPRSFRP